ncbi:cysteine methyltransferase [Opitutaceae bacterium EW11]|nr:cysteine methyltransferase [Opitutaceae bacterium EW11]
MPQLEFSTPIGCCRLAWNEAGLTGFWLPRAGSAEGGRQAPDAAGGETPAWIAGLIERIREHLTGRLQDFSDTPIDWTAVSEFQRGVYRETLRIRPGSVRSYGDIAGALGLGPAGARAVGVALGSNPWPLIVPCHRVVASDGRMTGFSAPGGIRTKTRLLVLEGAELISE